MDEIILLKAKMNTKRQKNLFILVCVLSSPFILSALLLGVWIGFVFIIGPIISYYCYKISKDNLLIITNKRVSFTGGKFGKRKAPIERNIPVDSITSVSKGFSKEVTITSSSGIITYYAENPTEVYDTINNLINKRLTNTENDGRPTQSILAAETKQTSTNDDTKMLHNMEMLRNYKKLLDDGILTQDEFDAKKKQLLEL